MLSMLCGLALAGNPLVVEVVDARGEPVPTAVVRFWDEGITRHRVHPQTGLWAGTVLYTEGHHEIPLRRGMVVKVDVWAPGFGLERLDLEVGGPTQQVVLEPLPSTDDPLAAPTLAAVATWREHARAPRDPDGWFQEARALESDVFEASRAWLAADSSSGIALQVCQMSATHPSACGR